MYPYLRVKFHASLTSFEGSSNLRDHLRHSKSYQFKWYLNYVLQLEALYKGQKEKLDATFAAIVAEREELEANVAAKELASKRSDADAEELIKVGCDHHKFFRVSLYLCLQNCNSHILVASNGPFCYMPNHFTCTL